MGQRSSKTKDKRKEVSMAVKPSGQFLLLNTNVKRNSHKYRLSKLIRKSYANVNSNIQSAITLPAQETDFDLNEGSRITRHAALAFANKPFSRSLDNILSEMRAEDEKSNERRSKLVSERRMSLFDYLDDDINDVDDAVFNKIEDNTNGKSSIRTKVSDDSAISLRHDTLEFASSAAPSLCSDDNGNVTKRPTSHRISQECDPKYVAHVYNSCVIQTWIENSPKRSRHRTGDSLLAEPLEDVHNSSFETDLSDISSISCSRRTEKFDKRSAVKVGNVETNFTTVLSFDDADCEKSYPVKMTNSINESLSNGDVSKETGDSIVQYIEDQNGIKNIKHLDIDATSNYINVENNKLKNSETSNFDTDVDFHSNDQGTSNVHNDEHLEDHAHTVQNTDSDLTDNCVFPPPPSPSFLNEAQLF